MSKKIGVVTTSRADYGLLYPIMKEIQVSKQLSLKIIATGMHLLPQYGYTINNIKSDFKDVDEIDMYLGNPEQYSLVKSIGVGFISFAEYLKYKKMDMIIILGDRSELIVPAYSAMLCGIPIAHIFGGDNIDKYVTYDNNIRHSITKIASIHFTAIREHSERIRKLGEEEWRIHQIGSPALDYIKKCNYITKEELQKKFKRIDFSKPYCVLTFHPVHTEVNDISTQIKNIIEAINTFNLQVIATYPNNDVGSKIIIDYLKKESNKNDKFVLTNSLLQEEYYSLLRYSRLMLGNSSSGVLESTSFRIPSINIGSRQRGRIKGDNVIDTDYSVNQIENAIEKSLNNKKFIKLCKNSINPYGDGNASKKLVEVLENIGDYNKLIYKRITY
ncbi:UDP-N-acetylglucosamine 2-epimerase [Crassaminicella thermophila]|nr:UDP-N-acetylglucosamine 2-epimerase [Crassaminicella thermophila]